MSLLFFKPILLFYFILFNLSLLGVVSCGGGGAGSSPSTDLNLSTQNCGNALLNENESCDDGNTNNSDGCNANCAWEVGEAICGNSVLENEECCEDGNTVSGDGCSSACTKEAVNRPPSTPLLATEPQNGATWAPTRLHLLWSPSTDADVGDQIVYDVYFVEGNGISPNAFPYKKGITDTHFIIQASTDNRSQYFPDLVAPIYLSPPADPSSNRQYTWKICARDKLNATACSETRVFKTDDSVVGWWRFDTNPVGAVCPAILGGPAGDPGETVCDYSGFGNHGIPNGGPMWLVPPMAGILGGALQFDGGDDSVIISSSSTMHPLSFSLQVKCMPVLGNLEQEMVDQRSAGYGLALRIGGSSLLQAQLGVKADNNLEYGATDEPTLVPNQTAIITGTYDHSSKTITLYREGLLKNTNVVNDASFIRTSSSSLTVLGGLSYPAPAPLPWLSGSLDEVILYNRVQNRNEIVSNVNSSN